MLKKTKKAMGMAKKQHVLWVSISVAMALLSLIWGFFIWGGIVAGIVALVFVVRFRRLENRSKSEPYFEELAGVVFLIDPKEEERKSRGSDTEQPTWIF